LKILIQTIPHSEQRYDTVGDWWIDPQGTWQVRVSELPEKSALFPEKYPFLVAIHELVEMALCLAAGISQRAVDAFDTAWAPHDDIEEPGEDPRAPYYEQHQMAMGIERTLAAALYVEWFEYERAINALSEPRAFGPGMTPHAHDCQCYVCTTGGYPAQETT
jgi:hypothetical protein